MPTRSPLRAAVLAALFTAGAATPLAAQTAPEITDAEAQAFAVAAIRINEITRDFGQRIQAVEAEDERERLADEARSEITGVFDETDALDARRYAEIARAAEGDAALAERLSNEIAEELE